MPKTNLPLPGIGLRNLKSALAVFLCILLYNILQRPYVFFACISAIICLSTSMETSYKMGQDRMIGTVFGGVLGVPFLYFNNLISDKIGFFITDALIIGLGIVFVIYFCNLIGRKGSTITSCVVFLSVVVGLQDAVQIISPFAYASNRMIDSAVGITIALLVNKYFYPFDKEEEEGKQEPSSPL